MISVEPHGFKPAGKWLHRNVCIHCFLPKRLHPILCWAPARPFGDRSKPTTKP